MTFNLRVQSGKSGMLLKSRPCSWVEVSTPDNRICIDGDKRKNTALIVFETFNKRFTLTDSQLAYLLEKCSEDKNVINFLVENIIQ